LIEKFNHAKRLVNVRTTKANDEEEKQQVHDSEKI